MAVQRFHSLQGKHYLHGQCSIRGSESFVGRIVCSLMRLPAQADNVAFAFELDASPTEEIWKRQFPGRAMRSRLRSDSGHFLSEHIGPAQLRFALEAHNGQLLMHLKAIRILGIPWPTAWFPAVWASEHGIDNRFHFDVGARFRHLGLLVAYSGYLELSAEGHAA